MRRTLVSLAVSIGVGAVAHDSDGVPPFNTSQAEMLASLDRFEKIAATPKAMVVIQHDARDVSKLPTFPAAAK